MSEVNCQRCAELQSSVDRLGKDWAKQQVELLALEAENAMQSEQDKGEHK